MAALSVEMLPICLFDRTSLGSPQGAARHTDRKSFAPLSFVFVGSNAKTNSNL